MRKAGSTSLPQARTSLLTSNPDEGSSWENRGAKARCGTLLVLIAVVPVPTGIAGVRQPTTVPAQLVGEWTRTVTKADVKRACGALILLAGSLSRSRGLGGLCSALASARWTRLVVSAGA
jgi:hypothetical protein